MSVKSYQRASEIFKKGGPFFSHIGARILMAVPCLLTLLVIAPYGLIRREMRDRSDAIVMFSGSSTYIERAQWAAKLWHEGKAPLIILTNDGQSAGWDEVRQRNPSFCERAADELQRQGVPAQSIKKIPQVVTSTHDEALRVLAYAQEHQLHSLQFVTSAYHTRRAYWTVSRVFAGSGVALGIDAPPTGQQSPNPWLWWASDLGWRLVPGEYLKFLYYRICY